MSRALLFLVVVLKLQHMREDSWKRRRQRNTRTREFADRDRSQVDDELTRTFNRAVKLLSVKSRSTGELREKLSSYTWTKGEVIDQVIKRLESYGYLDDERFAFSYASSKIQQKPVGRRKLQQELALKKVPREVVSSALDIVFDQTPEDLLIDRAIERRMRLRGRPEERREIKSLFDHLLRKGFDFDLVSSKVRALVKGSHRTD